MVEKKKKKKEDWYYVHFRLAPHLARKLKMKATSSGLGIAGYMKMLLEIAS